MLSCIRASQLPALLKQWQDSGVKAVFVDTPPAISPIREVVSFRIWRCTHETESPRSRAVVGTLELAYDKPVVFVINAAVMRPANAARPLLP